MFITARVLQRIDNSLPEVDEFQFILKVVRNLNQDRTRMV